MLKVLHATDSHFRKVISYKNYRLLNRLQTHNEKMVAKIGKYFEQMETLVKLYKRSSKTIGFT